jgi:hypothetical protein
MIFLGVPQNIYHFMEVLHTMTTIIMLVEEVNATMPQYLPIVITFMEQIRYSSLLIYYTFKLLVEHCIIYAGDHISNPDPPTYPPQR